MNPWNLNFNRGLFRLLVGRERVQLAWYGTSDTSESTLNDRYVSTLTDHLNRLIPISTDLDNSKRAILQVATEWFQEQYYDFRHFHWLPKFLYQHFIEHFWDVLQRSARERFTVPDTLMDVWTVRRILNANCLQDTLRYLSSAWHLVLLRFYVLMGALYNIRQAYRCL